jgi:DMSO reductase anchor subunit
VEAELSLRSEWPLAVFTLGAALLVALEAAAFANPIAADTRLFVVVALLVLLASTRHLGRQRRAWRAVLNVRRSWLSREVVCFGTFMGLSLAHRLLLPELSAVRAAAVAAGALTLVAIDRVYGAMAIHRIAQARAPGVLVDRLHSAQVLLTGPLLAACLAWSPPLIVLFGAAKLVLYVRRKLRRQSRGLPWRPGMSLMRVGLGLVAPALVWAAAPPMYGAWVTGLVLGGEIIDRGEFYEELELATPAALVAHAERAGLTAALLRRDR